MARRKYWVIANGVRIDRDTLQEISKVAKREANRIGEAVSVNFDEIDAFGRGGRVRAAVRHSPSRADTQVYSRNPMMQGHDFTGESWKITGKNSRGGIIHAFANSKREADDEARVLRQQGYLGIQKIRLTAPMQSNPGGYWMAYVREGGEWGPQFGSRDKEDVDFEVQDFKDHGTKAKDIKVVKFPHVPTQAQVMAARPK